MSVLGGLSDGTEPCRLLSVSWIVDFILGARRSIPPSMGSQKPKEFQ